MKLLGIDYGRKRVGMAVSDAEGQCIRGLTTLQRQKHSSIVEAVAAAVAQQAPDVIVVGVPLNSREEETEMSAEVRAFASALASAVSAPVRFVDESYSSIHAHEILRMRKRKERRNKGTVDRIAACLILETFLKEHACELARH